jgi:hypothetical protein
MLQPHDLRSQITDLRSASNPTDYADSADFLLQDFDFKSA